MSLAPAAAILSGTLDVHGVAADARRSGPLLGVHTSVCGITADDWRLIDYAKYPAPGLKVCEACLRQTVSAKP